MAAFAKKDPNFCIHKKYILLPIWWYTQITPKRLSKPSFKTCGVIYNFTCMDYSFVTFISSGS